MSSARHAMEDFNPSYIGIREDVLSLVPPEARRVLDIGCGIGALGAQIKARNNAEVVGIELDERMAVVAGEKLDRVLTGDVETMDLNKELDPHYFDCIICADILEHLKDPWGALKRIAVFLHDGGSIVASIPNVRHIATIKSLVLGGWWPYRERGIHDTSHLRFFTLRTIRELYDRANLDIVGIKRKYRIIERYHPLNRYAKCCALPLIRDFFTFQYLIVAKKRSAPSA